MMQRFFSPLLSLRVPLRAAAAVCLFGLFAAGCPDPHEDVNVLPDAEKVCQPGAGAPTANGSLCRVDGDCASCNCGENGLGEGRCYGKVSANGLCDDTYDCGNGLCLSDGQTERCVDVTWCERDTLPQCYKELAVLQCQHEKRCKPSDDFSNCVSFQCSLGTHISLSQCEARVKAFNSSTSMPCTK